MTMENRTAQNWLQIHWMGTNSREGRDSETHGTIAERRMKPIKPVEQMINLLTLYHAKHSVFTVFLFGKARAVRLARITLEWKALFC
jgi:hypothetical protein